jgi:hypothetical protein
MAVPKTLVSINDTLYTMETVNELAVLYLLNDYYNNVLRPMVTIKDIQSIISVVIDVFKAKFQEQVQQMSFDAVKELAEKYIAIKNYGFISFVRGLNAGQQQIK